MLIAESDDLTWSPDKEAKFSEKSDPEIAFLLRRTGCKPYSELYMYLVMKTIQSWSHVRNLLPDGKLKGGLNSVEEDLNSLLGYQYVSAFNKRKGISTMTFLDPDVYNDDDWCSAQAEADENWDKRKVIHLWTPELIATVDVVLASCVVKHVGVV